MHNALFFAIGFLIGALFAMMRELYGIANNLNQIAQKAHTLNVVDVQRYDNCARQVETAIKKITEAVVLPRPME